MNVAWFVKIASDGVMTVAMTTTVYISGEVDKLVELRS